MSNQYIKLKQPLNSFSEPNTSLAPVAKLTGEQYELLEAKTNYPDDKTDYACVRDAKFGNVWICIRYEKITYATIVTNQDVKESLPDFSADPLAIDETFLVNLLPSFKEFTYDLHDANYPFELSGINVPQAPPASNNCCTFVEAITVKAWQDAVPEFSWNSKKHSQMMVNGSDLYSPVTCLIESKIAEAIANPDSVPHRWTVIQGWKNAEKVKGGHTFIILDYHKETDRVLTLESNKAFGLNGVGFRKIGNFGEVGKPRAEWWNQSDLWTWEKIKSTYVDRKQCALKVKNINWI